MTLLDPDTAPVRTAVTLDLIPCQNVLVSYRFWMDRVLQTRIMLSPTPRAREPVSTGEKVRLYTNPPREGRVQQQSRVSRSQHFTWKERIQYQ